MILKSFFIIHGQSVVGLSSLLVLCSVFEMVFNKLIDDLELAVIQIMTAYKGVINFS